MNISDNIKIVGINEVFYMAQDLEEDGIDTYGMSDSEIVERWNEEYNSDEQDDHWGLSDDEYQDFLKWCDHNHMVDILEEKGISTENMTSDEVEETYWGLFE